ncbi:DUF397 domain-containing protein [Streptomyces sp. ERV7]|uniref:DUF397 domain-containing protein n=1 Tax=Streptomyces sp. ERV7 TaxID=1322334 RepID=UPI0007F372BF|nr:DUF397 domain-containing protein [Streptomyces sp. ERV7]OAR21926.1 DUF397 domain-containing protein [Streptomyces sp. ERV7]
MSHVDDASTLPVTWWKSSASGAQGDCVEFGIVSTATIAVRDSKAPHGPALLLGYEQTAAFVAAAASGQFGGLQ